MVKHSRLTYGDDICGDEIPAVEEHGEDDEVATHPRHTKETGLQKQQQQGNISSSGGQISR